MLARLTLAALPLLLAACAATPPSGAVAQVPLEPPGAGPLTLAPTTPPQSTVQLPPTAPAVAVVETPVTGPIDGLYRGRMWLVRGEPLQFVPTNAQTPELLAASAKPLGCPPSSLGNIEIGDSTLLYPYLPNVVFVAPVPLNGRIYAIAGQYVLQGTLIEGDLNLTVTSPSCESQLSFYRMPYF
ncbi:MAG TPA: hypothetical protein VHS58_19490 [Acetobacteraceae bacterium]|jgi:hypothetical protein|nr:hypothetical protein [Acetobacteraceae bacterium]